MEEKHCSACGKIFQGVKVDTICPSCKRKKGTNNYYGLGIVVIIIGVIAGIISAVSATDSDTSMYSFAYCIGSAIGFSVILFAIHSICLRLDVIANKLDSDNK